MFCPKCGAEVEKGSFCPKCGGKLPHQGDGDSREKGTAASPAPSARRIGKGAVVAALAVLVVAVVAFIVKPFGSAQNVYEVVNNTTLSYGMVTSDDGWDYFYNGTDMSICRAKPDGSEMETIVELPTDDLINTSPEISVQGIAVDGDYLFYVESPTISRGVENINVHRASLDGEEDEVIYTYEPEVDSSGYGYAAAAQLSVYNHELYFVTSNTVAAPGGSEHFYKVMIMDEEGECRLEEELARTESAPQFLAMPESFVWVDSSYEEKSWGDEFVLSEVDEGWAVVDEKDVCQLPANQICTSCALTENGVVFSAWDQEESEFAGVYFAPYDGAGIEEVYQGKRGSEARLLAVANDTVYMAVDTSRGVDSFVTWDLVAVPLGGGEEKVVARDVECYNPTMGVANGHLLLMENGQDGVSRGMRVTAMSFDGEVLAEYV